MRKHITKSALILSIISLCIAFLVIVTGALFTWGVMNYNQPLARYLSNKLGAEIKLDLENVSWEGINPVLNFKTIKINPKSKDFSSNFNRISVEISPIKSLFSWSIAASNVKIESIHLKLKSDFKFQGESVDFRNQKELQKTIQKELNVVLNYLDGIQPTVALDHLVIDLKNEKNQKIILSGQLSFKNIDDKYQLKGQLQSLSLNNRLGFDLTVGADNDKPYLRGYIGLGTENLAPIFEFLGIDQYKIYGKHLTINGHLNIQPEASSYSFLRFSAEELNFENKIKKTKLKLEKVGLDFGLHYQKNNSFKLSIIPHQLMLNNQELLTLHQLDLAYQDDGVFHWSIGAYGIDLKTINYLSDLLSLQLFSPEFNDYFNASKIKGNLDFLNVKVGDLFHSINPFTKNKITKTPFALSVDFSNIAYMNKKMGLMFSGLKGKIRLTNEDGIANLSIKKIKFGNYWLNLSALPLTSADLNAAWHLKNNHLDVSLKSLSLKNTLFDTNFNGQLSWNLDKTFPVVLLSANAKAYNPKQEDVQAFLSPDYIPTKLYDWLNTNIHSASEAQASLSLKGDLAKFPFLESPGEFKLIVKAKNASVSPWVGWPSINHIDGEMIFDNQKFNIKVIKGETEGLKVLPSTLSVGDIRPHIKSNMLLDLNIQSSGNQASHYLKSSPLKEDANNWLQWVSYQGNLDTNIQINVPLDDPTPATVEGKINLINGSLVTQKTAILPWQIKTTQTNGFIEFNQDSVKQIKLQGLLALDAPFTVDFIANQAKNNMNYQLNANMFLSDKMDLPYGIALNFQGIAPLKINANWDKFAGNALLSTNFQGLSSFLPEPFNKKDKNTELKSNLKLQWENNKLEKLKELSLNFNLAKRLIFLSQINFNPDRIKAFLALDQLDLDQWRYVSQYLLDNNQLSHWYDLSYYLKNLSFYQVEKSSENGVIPLELGFYLTSLIQKYKPDLALKLNHLAFNGQSFNNIKLMTKEQDKNWQGSLIADDKKQVDISFYIPLFENKPWQININNLSLNQFRQSKSETSLAHVIVPCWLPSIHLNLNQLMFNQHKIFTEGQILLDRNQNGFDIKRYFLKGDYIFLVGHGSWLYDENKIFLDGSASSSNWGKLVTSLNYPDVVMNANGPLSYNFSWYGGLSPSLATLDGEFIFGIKDGSIPKLRPGMAKLLGLFSVEAMIDRLTGANDLSTSGLYFNQIYGAYDFSQGVAKTKNPIIVDTPSFDMQVTGDIDFVKQTLEQNITIQPHLSGTVALAAGIFGGPIVGLATYIADKLAGASIFKNSGVAKVSVSGSFDNPKVKF